MRFADVLVRPINGSNELQMLLETSPGYRIALFLQVSKILQVKSNWDGDFAARKNLTLVQHSEHSDNACSNNSNSAEEKSSAVTSDKTRWF